MNNFEKMFVSLHRDLEKKSPRRRIEGALYK